MATRSWVGLLVAAGACDEAVEWAEKGDYPTFAAAWAACKRGDWMLWIAARGQMCDRLQLVLVACQVARTALKYTKDAGVKACIVTVEKWARGEDGVTLEMVQAARRAAAVAAAADAAYAAAYVDAAAYAAADAAYAAAYAVAAAADAAYAAAAADADAADAAYAVAAAADAAYAVAAAYAAAADAADADAADADAAAAARQSIRSDSLKLSADIVRQWATDNKWKVSISRQKR